MIQRATDLNFVLLLLESKVSRDSLGLLIYVYVQAAKFGEDYLNVIGPYELAMQ